ncbi:MAG: phosphotransferase [Candidatus Zixiibacteriota bacterium]|nr:MAG: phosphotransferase [candidate division Zixibacteria bacterium]
MEREIKAKFADSMLDETARKFGTVVDRLKFVSDSESFVFEYEKDNRLYIMRITHDSHRSYGQILTELDWLAYLSSNGVSVSVPVPSADNNIIEIVPADSSCFLASVFKKAEGEEVKPDDWTDDFFYAWGHYVGRLHALAREYRPPEGADERPRWDEEYNVCMAESVLADQPDVLSKQRELFASLKELPTCPDAYGLIHSDLEDENFFIENGRITAFDFDECQYNWFVYDLAAILRESTWRIPISPRHDRTGQIVNFWSVFSRGYLTANVLDPFWIEQMPVFLRWREICMYVYACGKCEIGPDDEKIMSAVKNRIINEIPLPDIDGKALRLCFTAD